MTAAQSPRPETRLAAIMARLPADDAAWLQSRVTQVLPADTRRQRLRDRDDAIIAAVAHSGLSVTRAAALLERDLIRYAATGWHSGIDPAEPRRALLHRILQLNGGKTLGWRQIFNVLKNRRGG